MTPAVLFWFYRDFEICQERLRLLRSHDPAARVFSLYGGPLDRTHEARAAVGEFVDDFWAYPYVRQPAWKWRHGDQLIARWHAERGHALDWKTIFVMQWDTLVLAPLGTLFRSLREGEILLSGLTPMNRVEAWWPWANTRLEELQRFKRLTRERFGDEAEILACLFIVACLPRVFLDRYVEIGHPAIGFLEYKVPTLARAFGVPACTDHPFHPWWDCDPASRDAPPRDRVLNAVGLEPSHALVRDEMTRADGHRIFHPFRRTF